MFPLLIFTKTNSSKFDRSAEPAVYCAQEETTRNMTCCPDHSDSLHCTALQCTALHCTALHSAVVETLDSRSVSPRLSAISSLAWSRSGVQPLLEHLGEHGEHVAGRQQALVVQHVHVDPGDKTAANQGRGCTHVWRIKVSGAQSYNRQF